MEEKEMKDIDDLVDKIKSARLSGWAIKSYAMGILSDAQHVSDPNSKDKLINKAKYVIGKYLSSSE
tara:strand:+ start:3491 stop:3688 length:198 start_codon:yes stop_codon:yes gene_type:complete